ncbi:MAG: CvpA family protein [Spirochaetales bacterium]|nr:CvpA family protein [Spirochaetales bacterium]
MVFSVLDVVLVLLLLVLAVRGVLRGFVAEVLSMAAIILGFTAAIFLSGPLSLLMGHLWGKQVWNQLIAFLVLFLAAYLIVKLIEGAIINAMENMELQNLDKALGFFLGLFEGVLLVVLLLFVIDWLSWLPVLAFDKVLVDSFLAKFILPLVKPIIYNNQSFLEFFRCLKIS